MERQKSKYPLMARIDDIDQDHPILGKGIQCFRCGAGYIVLNGPHVMVGNNIEGVLGMLCGPCSKEHIRNFMPNEAVKYGLLNSRKMEERNRRSQEIEKEFTCLSGAERHKRRKKNEEEGNLCIVCESEPKEGFEGKYAKDLCQICYEYFARGYINGDYASVEDFIQSGFKPGIVLKNAHWH